MNRRELLGAVSLLAISPTIPDGDGYHYRDGVEQNGVSWRVGKKVGHV